jgi:hypothetical protein
LLFDGHYLEDASAIDHMIRYFYHHNYPSPFPTQRDQSKLTTDVITKGILIIHAKMYAMGEKYQVPGLKALAVNKFRACWYKTNSGLGTAIVVAYMSTPETDQPLREMVVDMLVRSPWMPKTEVLDETIKRIPELVYALYRKIANRL